MQQGATLDSVKHLLKNGTYFDLHVDWHFLEGGVFLELGV